MTPWLQILAGFGLLTLGAEGLVRGAASLAARLGISTLVVGLTVVAYGTSAPELAVSVIASLRGSEGLAIGNVVGSNIANLGLVLGLAAMVSPLRAEASLLKRELPFMIAAAVMVPALGWDGHIDRGDGVVLLVGAALFTSVCMLRALTEGRRARAEAEVGAQKTSTKGLAVDIVFLIIGTAALVGGGEVLVRGATTVAEQMGISDRVIGLSVVALGTSLPELATSLTAVRKGQLDLAVGNVIGSNIFNVLFILGSAASVHPLIFPEASLSLDVVVMLGLSFVMVPMVFSGERISRREGALLGLCYLAFIASLALGGIT